jgi:hypothetical protein
MGKKPFVTRVTQSFVATNVIIWCSNQTARTNQGSTTPLLNTKKIIMKIKVLAFTGLLLFCGVVFFSACEKEEDNPGGNTLDCSTVTGATYTSNSGKIKSILESKCASGSCHGAGGSGRRDWAYADTYAGNQASFNKIVSAIKNGTMPKSGSPRLSQTELDQITCWSQNGFKE